MVTFSETAQIRDDRIGIVDADTPEEVIHPHPEACSQVVQTNIAGARFHLVFNQHKHN